MKIKLLAPVIAVDSKTDLDLTDAKKIKALTETEYEECFSDHFQEDELSNIGLTEGYLRFFINENKSLTVLTEYKSPRSLEENEVSALVEYTLGQWLDGIGSNFSQEYQMKKGVSVAFFASEETIIVKQEI
jgi:hypothetical protein